MNRFLEHCEAHAGLQIFDPEAFCADEDVSESVCAFVLALAVIYNDSKDVSYAHELLRELAPSPPPLHSRAWGVFGGMDLHLFRLHIGLLHELFKLIQANEVVLRDDYLRSVVNQLPASARASWNTLVEVALGATPSDRLGRSLLLARNKIAYHYDAEQILRGYKEHFCGPNKRDEWAHVSRGPNMARSRFYFADAAVQGYIHNVASVGSWQELTSDISSMLHTLNFALRGIVERFVQKRAGCYRDFNDEVA